jgi:hypothetical protein
MSTSKVPPTPEPERPARSTPQDPARLAEALRSNLARRKAQQRARDQIDVDDTRSPAAPGTKTP